MRERFIWPREIPQRLSVGSMRKRPIRIARQNALEALSRLRIAMKAAITRAEVVDRVDILRLESQHFFQRLTRFLEALKIGKRLAAVVLRAGVVGISGDRAIVPRHRLVEFSLERQHDGQVA